MRVVLYYIHRVGMLSNHRTDVYGHIQGGLNAFRVTLLHAFGTPMRAAMSTEGVLIE